MAKVKRVGVEPAEDTALHGMGEITRYAKRCDATIIKLVRSAGFPARKVGGSWVSDKRFIDEFWRDQIKQKAGQEDARKVEQMA